MQDVGTAGQYVQQGRPGIAGYTTIQQGNDGITDIVTTFENNNGIRSS